MPDPVKEPEEEETPEAEEVEVELDAAEEAESSWEELLAKRAEKADDEDEDSVFNLSPDDRVESLSVRATPPQADEFICASCRLVKKKSQLADRKRRLCRDCV